MEDEKDNTSKKPKGALTTHTALLCSCVVRRAQVLR